MITALNAELLGQDPTKVEAITEALDRLARHEESEADRDLFAMFRMVGVGLSSDMLVVTQIGGGR